MNDETHKTTLKDQVSLPSLQPFAIETITHLTNSSTPSSENQHVFSLISVFSFKTPRGERDKV